MTNEKFPEKLIIPFNYHSSSGHGRNLDIGDLAMIDPIEIQHMYKANFNKKTIEFDGMVFKPGEVALHRKATRLNDDGTQTETYHFYRTSFIREVGQFDNQTNKG